MSPLLKGGTRCGRSSRTSHCCTCAAYQLVIFRGSALWLSTMVAAAVVEVEVEVEKEEEEEMEVVMVVVVVVEMEVVMEVVMMVVAGAVALEAPEPRSSLNNRSVVAGRAHR